MMTLDYSNMTMRQVACYRPERDDWKWASAHRVGRPRVRERRVGRPCHHSGWDAGLRRCGLAPRSMAGHHGSAPHLPGAGPGLRWIPGLRPLRPLSAPGGAVAHRDDSKVAALMSYDSERNTG